jgi:phosphate transport system substrate-binding protein
MAALARQIRRSFKLFLFSRSATSVVMMLLAVAVLSSGCRFQRVSKRGADVAAARAWGERSIKVLTGAGATFPYPLYAKWGKAWNDKTKVRLNYQSIGSGGGIKQIKAGTVDFGASDAPLKPKDLRKAGLVQFPLIMGGVCQLCTSRALPTASCGWMVRPWPTCIWALSNAGNDPRLLALNPGLQLPDQAVTPVYRADGSGTTWIYTSYLSKISKAWKEKVGHDKSVSWPTGVGGKGNEGVAAYVQRVDGAIGYVEHAYAVQNHFATTQLKNRAGTFVHASIPSFQAAAANADWAGSEDFYVVLTDQPGPDSWPITGASFILVHKDQPGWVKTKALLDFFSFGLRQGAEMASNLHYVPLPGAVVDLVEQSWSAIVAEGRPVWPVTPQAVAY